MWFLLNFDTQAVDFALADIDDCKNEILVLEGLANLGDAAELVKNKTANAPLSLNSIFKSFHATASVLMIVSMTVLPFHL